MAKMKWILETKRLRLRELEPADFENLCGILQDEKAMYAYGHAFSDQETWEWLDRQRGRYERYGFGLWAVIEKKSGRFVGQCGLSMQDWAGGEVLEVGYLLRRDCWHQGFAAEAAMACKEYAFEKLGAEEVFSIIREDNLASQKVAERNGMTVKGRFVKHYRHQDMPHLVFSVRGPGVAQK